MFLLNAKIRRNVIYLPQKIENKLEQKSDEKNPKQIIKETFISLFWLQYLVPTCYYSNYGKFD